MKVLFFIGAIGFAGVIICFLWLVGDNERSIHKMNEQIQDWKNKKSEIKK